jgi:hypothetical protein
VMPSHICMMTVAMTFLPMVMWWYYGITGAAGC